MTYTLNYPQYDPTQPDPATGAGGAADNYLTGTNNNILPHTDWMQTQSIPQLDPSMNTLQEVDITWSGGITTQIKVENISPSSGNTIMSSANGNMTINGAGISAAPTTFATVSDSHTDTFPVFDNDLADQVSPFGADFAGTSGTAYAPKTGNGSGSNTITSSFQLLPFIGTGLVTYGMAGSAASNANDTAGNFASDIQTTATGQITVTYIYQPNQTPNCPPTMIQSNFNGTAIQFQSVQGNQYIWYESHAKISGISTSSITTLHFINQFIDFKDKVHNVTYHLAVPDADIIFNPAVTTATVNFTGTKFIDTYPASGLSGDFFVSGLAFPVPATGLPGGINPVTWSGNLTSDVPLPNVKMSWQWAAAVYQTFTTNYNALGIKPVDDSTHSVYKNSDHAGTPENFKKFVVGGARGGGGSNFTGSNSSTVTVGPCPPTQAVAHTATFSASAITAPTTLSTLSGIVYNDLNRNGIYDGGDVGIPNTMVYLSGLLADNCCSPGQAIETDSNGNYAFLSLPAGTYSVSFDPPAGYSQGAKNVGSLGGLVTTTGFSNIGITGGQNGANYNFGMLPIGISAPSITGNTVSYTITNNSTAALTLKWLQYTFPTGDGNLTKVTMNGNTIFNSSFAGPNVLLSGWLGTADLRTIGVGQSVVLSFTFSKTAAMDASKYKLHLDFGIGGSMDV